MVIGHLQDTIKSNRYAAGQQGTSKMISTADIQRDSRVLQALNNFQNVYIFPADT